MSNPSSDVTLNLEFDEAETLLYFLMDEINSNRIRDNEKRKQLQRVRDKLSAQCRKTILRDGMKLPLSVLKAGHKARERLAHHAKRTQLAADIKKDIDSICCIYPTIAMYEEPRTRLAERISHRILGDY